MAGNRQRIRLLLIVMAMALPRVTATAVPFPKPPWESGSFARLPLRGSGDLVTYVDSLPHGPSYVMLDPGSESQVGAMFDSIQAAITAMIGGTACPDCNTCPNWCAAVTVANNAGYLIGRYYDTVSQRWFIVGADGSGAGQAYFIINPEPRRDLVIEAPHVYADNARLEGRTDTEGALLLRQTLGRALLINGADRCQGPDNGCGGTFSGDQVCTDYGAGDKYRRSDAAHNTDNAFHVLHKKLNAFASTRFVQLHGNSDERLPKGGISVSDGRKTWQGSSGVATAFANAIQTLPNGALAQCLVNECTIEDKNLLCGYRNVQGRYTNDPDPNVSCDGDEMAKGGTRFLHLEQRSGGGGTQSLIDAVQPVSDALRAIFPCMGGCSLPAQPFVAGPDCPGIIQAPPCPEFFSSQSRSACATTARPRKKTPGA